MVFWVDKPSHRRVKVNRWYRDRGKNIFPEVIFFPPHLSRFVSSVRTKLYNLIQTSFKKRYYWRLIFDFVGEFWMPKESSSITQKCYCFQSEQRVLSTKTHLNTPVSDSFLALVTLLSIRRYRKWKVRETQKQTSCLYPEYQFLPLTVQLCEVVCSRHRSWQNCFGD